MRIDDYYDGNLVILRGSQPEYFRRFKDAETSSWSPRSEKAKIYKCLEDAERDLLELQKRRTANNVRWGRSAKITRLAPQPLSPRKTTPGDASNIPRR